MSFVKKTLNQQVEEGQHALVSSGKLKYCMLVVFGANGISLTLRILKENPKISNKFVPTTAGLTYRELLKYLNLPMNLQIYKSEEFIPVDSYATALLEVKREWDKFSINFPQWDNKKPLNMLPLNSFFKAGRYIYIKDKVEVTGSFKNILAKRVENEEYSRETYLFGYGQKVKQVPPPYGAML